MTRFVVDLGRAELSDHKKKAIAGAIQATVIQHLADLPHVASPPQLGYIPWWWLGYILREEIDQVLQAEKEIGRFAVGELRGE